MSKRKPPVAQGLNHRLDFTRLLPVCVLLSVSLWLLGDTVSAESSYRVAPKIAPHGRSTVQQPAMQTTTAARATSASLKAGSPALDESLGESKILPVSYQASTKSGAAVRPAPTTAQPVKASVTRTAIQSPEPQKAHEPNSRPVVKLPAEPVPAQPMSHHERLENSSAQKTFSEPDVMDPAMDDMTPPLRSSQPKPVSQAASPVARLQPQAVTKAEKPERKSEKPQQKVVAAKVSPAKTPENKAEQPAKPVKTAKGKKEHPVVIAPEPLLAGPDAFATPSATRTSANPPSQQKVQTAASGSTTKTASASAMKPAVYSSGTPVQTASNHTTSRAHTWEPGFYPVGYTPAVRPVTPEKMQALDTALTHYNRGVYYTQRKQWDAAVKEYQQVIRQNTNMADAYVGLSTAAIYQRDWENALKNGVKALRLKNGFIDPANITQARYNVSSVYCVADDYKQAMHYYKLVKKDHHPQTDTLWSFLQTTCQPKKQPKPY